MRGFAALGRARVLASWTLWIAPEISPSSPFLRGGALLCSPWLLRLRSRLTNDRERLPQARARSCRCDRVGAHGSSGLPGGREDLRDAGLSGRVVGHGVASAGRSGSVHPGRSARVCSGERRLGQAGRHERSPQQGDEGAGEERARERLPLPDREDRCYRPARRPPSSAAGVISRSAASCDHFAPLAPTSDPVAATAMTAETMAA